MATRESTPKRVRADIAAAAKLVAPQENRSETEQINYWASLGMQMERAATAPSRRLLSVVAGETQFTELNDHERARAHAMIDAAIAEHVEALRFGDLAIDAGHPVVCLDDDGHLVEIAPDGASRRL